MRRRPGHSSSESTVGVPSVWDESEVMAGARESGLSDTDASEGDAWVDTDVDESGSEADLLRGSSKDAGSRE
jgi:hypothetical protein